MPSRDQIATRLRTVAWIARSLATDLRYGGILAGNVRSRYRDVGAYNVANSPYAVLPQMFGGRVGPEDVLVDVGCGKGRVINWWLSRGLRNRIYGIEIDPEVAAAAAHRLRRHDNVTIVNGDATTSVPDDATLLYLYNPFDGPSFERFRDDLAHRFGARGITALYWNPYWVGVFENDPRWSVERVRIADVADPRIAGAHREYAVVRLAPEPAGSPSGQRGWPSSALP